MRHVWVLNPYRVFVGNQKDRVHGRPVHRWKDNIKTNFQEIGFESVHSTDLGAQGWEAFCCEYGKNLLFSYDVGNCLTS
jgi:hypothetical protein